MTTEERNNIFQSAPSYIKDFILSPVLVEKTSDFYKKMAWTEGECMQISTVVLDILLTQTDAPQNIWGSRFALLPLDANKKSALINFIGKEILPLIKKPQKGFDHDINKEWYDKERDEILREIEGPQRTAIPATVPTPPSPRQPSPPPLPQSRPSAPPAAPQQQQPRPLPASVSASTPASVVVPVSAPSRPAAPLTTNKPLATPTLQPKIPTIFSMPRTATTINQPATKPVTASPSAGNTPTVDPYREPPTA